MKNKFQLYLFISYEIMLIIALYFLNIGVYTFSESSVFKIFRSLFSDHATISTTDVYIFGKVHLPRVIMAIFIGSMLAIAGTCLQGIFKNPLATPDLIGVTSGAMWMAAISIILGGYIGGIPSQSSTILYD